MQRDTTEGGAGAVEPQPPPMPAPETQPEFEPTPSPPPDESNTEHASAETEVGLWECMNDSKNCTLAAPDPRTPARLFEGPTQKEVRESGERLTCPNCGGDKVWYRGIKRTDAVAAA